MFIQAPFLYSFGVCYLIDNVLQYLGFTGDISNVLSCISFQTYISLKCLYLISIENIDNIDTIYILQNLYGYFVYDLIGLFLNDFCKDKKVFIVHHLISCVVINVVLLSDIGNNLYAIYFIFLTESSGLLTNLRIILRGFSKFKKTYKKIITIYYLVARVILLPSVAVEFMEDFECGPIVMYSLYITFILLYIMSLVWFVSMVKSNIIR